MSDAMITVEENYRDIVLEIALADPLINKIAISLAYYTAMLDAALCYPMDDPADQEEVLARYRNWIHQLTEQFIAIVNEKL